MFVQIKRKDKEYDVPKYQTPGSVGFDFTTREDATIWPNEIVLIPANATVRTPKGYMLMVALRSSAPRKWGVTIPQGVGIVDQDYCGPEDEIMLQVLNFRDKPVMIPKGTRLAQGVFIKVGIADFQECSDHLYDKSRGGFGSTGD